MNNSKEILKGLLTGKLTSAEAKAQLKMEAKFYPVVAYGDGTYSIALGTRMSEAELLSITGASCLEEVNEVIIEFTS